jgi:integrase
MAPVNQSTRVDDSTDSTALVRQVRGELVPPKRGGTLVAVPAKTATDVGNYYRRAEGGAWYFRKKINGQPINVTTGLTDLTLAKRRGHDIEAEVRAAGFGWTPKTATVVPTVKGWFTEYLSTYSPLKRNPRSDKRVTAFMEAHAKLKLTEVTPLVCQKWIGLRLNDVITCGYTKGKKRAVDTVICELIVIKAIFAQAVTEGHLTSNPWRGLTTKKKNPRLVRVARKRKLSPAEQEALLEALAAPRRTYDGGGGASDPGSMVRAVQTILGSGVRLAELLSLTPGHVRGGALHVIGKGGKARTIPLQAATLAVLDAQREAQGLGKTSDTRLWPMAECQLGKFMQRACGVARIPRTTPHDLRRTYATRLVLAGVIPKVLQALMGHASYEITMRHYEVIEDDNISAAVASVDLGL